MNTELENETKKTDEQAEKPAEQAEKPVEQAEKPADEKGEAGEQPTTGEGEIEEITPEQATELINNLTAQVEQLKSLVLGDQQFEKPEDAYNAMQQKIAELVEVNKRNQEASVALKQLFDREPAVAEAIRMAIEEGKSFRVALLATHNIEDLIPTENDADYEEYQKVMEENAKKAKQMEEFEAKLHQNLNESAENIKKFFEERKMDEKQQAEFMNFVDKFLQDAYSGKITKEYLDAMHKSMMFEQEVQKAEKKGEIKGLNKKIVVQKATKKENGDGLPNLEVKSKKVEEEEGFVKRNAVWIDELVKKEQQKSMFFK